MNANDIKNCIDNKEKIFTAFNNLLESLPIDIINQIEENSNNVDALYNSINNINPDFFKANGLNKQSFKFLFLLDNLELGSKLFSEDEYVNILKTIVDIYGNKISTILSIDSENLDLKSLDGLLSLNDSKYTEAYKSVVLKKLITSSSEKEVIEIINNCNSMVLDKDLIINFLNGNKSLPLTNNFIDSLPISILQDGEISKSLLKRNDNIIVKALDYIPSSAYDSELVKELLNKMDVTNGSLVLEHIPKNLRTKEFWEKSIDCDYKYVYQLPNHLEVNMSLEEYNDWVENIIFKTILKYPQHTIRILSGLVNTKKTVSLCQKVADYVNLDSSEYSELLNTIPTNCRTQQLYTTLVKKSPNILKDVPRKSISLNISQEQYNEWFENLIIENLDTATFDKETQGVPQIESIPKDKINERIWNYILDKCLEKRFDKKYASLINVEYENITPQMVERAMKDIAKTEIFNVPCIDKNYDTLPDKEREKYIQWQTKLTDNQKEAYRNWYENLWLDFLSNTKSALTLFNHVPKEALTDTMCRECFNIEPSSIQFLPLPDTTERIQEYQQFIIYALNKCPTIDYQDDLTTKRYGNDDILEFIPKEYINDEIINTAIRKNYKYLSYANPNNENFNALLDIAFKNKLTSIGRENLTEEEKNMMKEFAINNADFFKTIQLEVLNPKIVNAIDKSSLEIITRYEDIQKSILRMSEDETALKTFGFVLENIKEDNKFIEPLIEKLTESINQQKFIAKTDFSFDKVDKTPKSIFLDIVAQRIDDKSRQFTDYEKAIISYLALNPDEGRKIMGYEDILNFVKRKDCELERTIANKNSTLFEIKNAYTERLVGLKYSDVVNLVTMYGNDSEQLLEEYTGKTSLKELSEVEALQIIIKLKSLVETEDVEAIKNEFQNYLSLENKEESFLRYKKSILLEKTLRRAYGRDVVNSLSKNTGIFQEQELEYNGEKYIVRKVNGDFNRMVSLLGAYRKSSATEGDMYDRWNTNQMANNHALCYSLINQSNPGTAMIEINNGSYRKGIVISIKDFSPEALTAAAPYDLCSDNRHNTAITRRQQKFFSTKNMPDYTRGNYSEYDIEIKDVLSNSEKYQKIQPDTIICFEQIDEESIQAAIELGRKLGHPIPIELIDRRELAQNEMTNIKNILEKFKNDKTMNSDLVEEIISRFNNVRNANREAELSDELVGENKGKENDVALFNKKQLNQMLKECLSSIEQKIKSGQVQEGLQALDNIKGIIKNEREKSILMPTMYEKQLLTGIDLDIDYNLDELQRTYGKPNIKPLEHLKSLETISEMNSKNSSSLTFDVTIGQLDNIPEQLSPEQIIQMVDLKEIQKDIAEVHSQGFYQGNVLYDEEHVARVLLYSEAISKMEGFDDKTQKLVSEVAKYYSCGRQLDIAEKHEKYSAKLAGKSLSGKYTSKDIQMIQAAIELQNFKIWPYDSPDAIKDKNVKSEELCNKYGLTKQESIIVSKMANCVKDSVELDQTRFVDKAKNVVPEQSFSANKLDSESAKKMIKFSYLLQEQLAQQNLNNYKDVIKVDFGSKKEDIMDKFFTEQTKTSKIRTKNIAITESPIVKLEYLKELYPETRKIDVAKIKKQKDEEKAKDLEKKQLEEQRKLLRRRAYEIKTNGLGLQSDAYLSLDGLFKQQEELQQLTFSSPISLESVGRQR